jgi:hypothetical protein
MQAHNSSMIALTVVRCNEQCVVLVENLSRKHAVPFTRNPASVNTFFTVKNNAQSAAHVICTFVPQ